MTPEFMGFPKIKRWNRDIVITEKIDGTNAQIYIQEDLEPITLNSGRVVPFLCGSRSRWIFPENDNHGFARWAYENIETIMQLGPGHHYGEWWGQSIQRGYGLKEKRFSLFNVSRWNEQTLPKGIYVVPILYTGPIWNTLAFFEADRYMPLFVADHLRGTGSIAAPGYMKPEGIVVYHTAGGHLYKITLENDDKYKGMTHGNSA